MYDILKIACRMLLVVCIVGLGMNAPSLAGVRGPHWDNSSQPSTGSGGDDHSDISAYTGGSGESKRHGTVSGPQSSISHSTDGTASPTAQFSDAQNGRGTHRSTIPSGSGHKSASEASTPGFGHERTARVPESSALGEWIGVFVTFFTLVGLVVFFMRNEDQLKLRTKLVAVLATLLLLLAGVAGVSMYKLNNIGNAIEGIAERDIPLTEVITAITVKQLEQAVLFERAMLAGETKNGRKLQHIEQAFRTLAAEVDETIKRGEAMAKQAIAAAHSKEETQEFQYIYEHLGQIERQHGNFDAHVEQAFALLNAGDIRQAIQLADLIEAEEDALGHEMERFLLSVETFTEDAARRAKHDEQIAIQVMMASVAMALLFGALMGYLLVRGLLRQIGGEPKEISEVAGRIAQGDLSTQFTHTGEETGIYAAMKTMQADLKTSVEEVQEIVEHAQAGDLSQRIDLAGKKGFVEQLGQGLNTLLEINELVIKDTLRVLGAMSDGDLSQRTDVTDKSGYFEKLSQGLNALMEISERVIKDTLRVLGAMSYGDLTENISAEYKGSFGQLKRDVNATVYKLTEVIGKIKTGAESVSSGAEEMSHGNTNLSQRTEEQASSLEETASSMEQMTATVRQNADNARQADQLAAGAREQAEKGGQVVGNAVSAMAEINNASKKIADIIGVIDEIAFQTNLLALNAAVEAARAGEQGRGFAVVASEVRNLAQRSATAAKEIKGLIEDSVVKVEQGSQLVNQSGQTLDEIVTSVKRVSDIIAEIAAASLEQSAGIEQVNKAIMQMDDVTQQNASLVEETAGTSKAMDEQARSMNDLVGFFKVSDQAAEHAATTGGDNAKGKERRSAKRPWADHQDDAKVMQESTPKPKLQHAASGSRDETEWDKF